MSFGADIKEHELPTIVEERIYFMEDEVKDRPVEDTSDNFEQAFVDLGLGEEQSEEISDEVTKPEGEETPKVDEVSKETPVDEFNPLLDKLSKEIKFMDQEVKIGSLDELKEKVQKGLNYGRLEDKIQSLENSKELLYVRNKAKSLGMTPEQFIENVEQYEKQQEQEQEKVEFDKLVNGGVDEEIAKKVIETNRLAKEWQKEKADTATKLAAQEAKAREQEKLDEFVKTYPNVNFKDIPKEVFLEAEKTDLTTAYTKYENAQLKKQLEIMQTNIANQSSSPVKGTTEHGGIDIVKVDPFLKGWED